MKTKKRLQDYTWEELLEATSGKESLKEAGRDSGNYTKDNKLAIHTDDSELRKEWASMGGEASIEKLLQWQIDNGFRVCDLERTEEWCNNISIALTGNVLSKKHKQSISKALKKYMNSLTKEERSRKHSNNARANTARIKRIKILNSIRVDEFDSIRLHKACDRFEYDFDLLARDKTLLKRIHKGTNQNNPSVYKKIYK